MNEKKEIEMAVNKKSQSQTTTVSNKAAMSTAKKVIDKYKKTFEKLSKN